jgi:hypothetical protein
MDFFGFQLLINIFIFLIYKCCNVLQIIIIIIIIIMLKFIYNGEFADDPEKLTLDLLNLADMYLLDRLKGACLKRIVSCISTFIMASGSGVP